MSRAKNAFKSQSSQKKNLKHVSAHFALSRQLARCEAAGAKNVCITQMDPSGKVGEVKRMSRASVTHHKPELNPLGMDRTQFVKLTMPSKVITMAGTFDASPRGGHSPRPVRLLFAAATSAFAARSLWTTSLWPLSAALMRAVPPWRPGGQCRWRRAAKK